MTEEQALQNVVNLVYVLDKSVRYAAFVNVQGQTVVGGIRQGVRSLDSDEKEKARLRQLAVSGIARRYWEETYGKYAYTIMKFQKLILGQFPFRDMAMIVSLDPTSSVERIFDQIDEVLAKNR
jgi:hypothetical protein